MKITIDDVVQEVRKLATEQPDFNYKNQAGVDNWGMSCSYLAGMTSTNYKDSTLSESGLTYNEARQLGMLGNRCIVGQALSKLGVSDETLYEFEGMGADYTVGSITGHSEESVSGKLLWLLEVQNSQDVGNPWGSAVEYVDTRVKL